MKMIEILFIFAFISKSFAATAEGPCPEVTAINNFNLTAYIQGQWYEIARYPNEFEGRGDCVSYYFEQDNGQYKYHVADIIDHKIKYIEGNFNIAPNAGNTGVLNFYFVKNQVSIEYKSYVLDTDYDNYQISYECIYNEMKNIRNEYAWIGGRAKKLSSEARTAVDNFLKSSRLIDAKKLIWDHFTDDACNYSA